MPTDENDNPKEIGVVTMCYAAYDKENDKWVKGCSYDRCPKGYVDKLIGC